MRSCRAIRASSLSSAWDYFFKTCVRMIYKADYGWRQQGERLHLSINYRCLGSCSCSALNYESLSHRSGRILQWTRYEIFQDTSGGKKQVSLLFLKFFSTLVTVLFKSCSLCDDEAFNENVTAAVCACNGYWRKLWSPLTSGFKDSNNREKWAGTEEYFCSFKTKKSLNPASWSEISLSALSSNVMNV